MSSDPIICHCDEGCGLPHIHRNPPYDTDGRNELLRKRREEYVPQPRTPLPTFEPDDVEPDPPLSPNELDRIENAATRGELIAIMFNRGCCENHGCLAEDGGPRKATLRVGRYNFCEKCSDDRDRGKDPATVEQRIRLEDLK
jgi:hypothetical protein